MSALEKVTMILIIVMFSLFSFSILFGYQIPMMEKQSKQLFCLDHGFYDYDSSTDSCYEINYKNMQSIQVIKENKIFGAHCSLSDNCRKLLEEVKK